MYDITILGGGPAGLTALLYSIQKGLKCLLISKDLGGKTNYRLSLPWMVDPVQGGPGVLRGIELVNMVRSELDLLTFDFINEAVETVERKKHSFSIQTQGPSGEAQPKMVDTRALIVATGTHQTLLNVPGEKEYFLRSLAYSALSYAPLFKERVVAVVGEGELAIRSAAELARVAQKVYLVCSHMEMFSTPLGIKLAAQKNVTILDGYLVVEIKGDGKPFEGYARALEVRNRVGKTEELIVDGIFIEKGLVPNSKCLAGLVQTDPAGRIRVDENNSTSTNGIFAAGDVTNLYGENLIVAMGDGAKAALSAFDYLLPIL